MAVTNTVSPWSVRQDYANLAGGVLVSPFPFGGSADAGLIHTLQCRFSKKVAPAVSKVLASEEPV